MADIEFINDSFIQKGPICAIASYAIIIDYFADHKVTIADVLDYYVNEYDIKFFSFGKNVETKKHQSISKHFHEYCRNNGNIRGFEFIKQLHENNILITERFCEIIGFKAALETVSNDDIDTLRYELKNNDAVAMILYKVNNKNFHAVVIGYDTEIDTYFYKDPEQKKIQRKDILSEKDIWEYIIFKDKM